jgi:hypothetical protein
MELTYENLQQYLKGETGQTVEIEEIHQLSGVATGPQALKQFGYGRPGHFKNCTSVSGNGTLLRAPMTKWSQ